MRSFVAVLGVCAVVTACGTTVPQTTQVRQFRGAASTGGDPSGTPPTGQDTTSDVADGGSSAASSAALGATSIATAPGGLTPSVAPGATTIGSTNPGSVSAPGTTNKSGTTGNSKAPARGSTPSKGASGRTSAKPSPKASTASAAAGIPNGVGMTATTIKIGVYTADGFDAIAASAGAGTRVGNGKDEATAIINYLNAHGGIAGRQIVPVFYDTNVSMIEANGADSDYTAACATWTEDNQVFAVASAVQTFDDSLYQCLSKHGVLTAATGEQEDASFFQKYGAYAYEPNDFNLNRALTTEVDALAKVNFFPKGAQIGILNFDAAPYHAAVDSGLKPELAKLGLTVASEYDIPETAGGASQYSQAVLKFRAAGVNVVLPTFAPLLFMEQAQSQGYTPLYGLNSRLSPAAELQGDAPAQQLVGSVGIGWQPDNDVDAARDPGPVTARETLCNQVLTAAGIDESSRATTLVATWYCDALFFLHDAMAAATTYTVAGFQAAAESLHPYESAATFASSLSPGQAHDGAAGYRVFAYTGSCSCFSYTSPLIKSG